MKPIIVTDERAEKLRRTISNRQPTLTVVLENVHDPHNLGAVLRTCDSVGILEIFALYTIESPITLEKIASNKSASGSKKWVDIHYFNNPDLCIQAVKKKYSKVFATHLASDAVGLYELDLTQSVALVFGNEKRGITKDVLDLVDGNFIIPQMGLVQSLNISVACAVTLYEALRQRKVNGMYDADFDENNPEHLKLFEKYQER